MSDARGPRRRGLGRPAWVLLATLFASLATAVSPAAAAGIQLTAGAAKQHTYSWAIDKTADTTAVTLGSGQTATVNYTVVATPTLAATAHSAAGAITVANETGAAQTVQTLAVSVIGVGPATVTCPVALPHVLAAAASLVCAWEITLPDATTRAVVLTATIDGSDSSAGATIDFATASTTEIDECANVYDLNVDLLGTACAPAGASTFQFPVTFGPFEECVDREVENIAWFETNDTEATAEDAWTFTVTCATDENTPCGEVKGDGRISTNVKFDYTFYNVKFENGVMKTIAEISFVDTLDRQNKVKFVSTTIDTWVIVGNQATITGTGLVNGTIPVTFVVVATDGGTGGTDTFSIVLSNGYTASGDVTTGRGVNIRTC